MRRRQNRRRYLVLLVVLGVLVGAVITDNQIRPLLQEYSSRQAEWHATRLINEAVSEVLAVKSPTYNTLIDVQRDAGGNVTSVVADTAAVNLLKADVSAAVAGAIGQKQEITVRVPIGSLIGTPLFSGWGPRLSVPVSISGSVLTDIKSTFEDAGVNQTSHRLKMEMTARVFVGLPTAHSTVIINTSFIIAESILVGKVPEAYTVVITEEDDVAEEIFDHGAEKIG